MYREKLVEQLKLYEERQRMTCVDTDDFRELSRDILAIAKKIDELDQKTQSVPKRKEK